MTRDADSRVHGSVTRQGVTFIEINGRVSGDLPVPGPYQARQFWFKFMPAVDGIGFDGDPLLVRLEQVRKPERVEGIEGELILRQLAGCPVVDLPIRQPPALAWVQRSSDNRPKVVGPVDATAFARHVPIRYR